ncbi:hypothetical protein TSOC_007741 [Tetrabaena socialis]|uniref:Diphthine--ammonia ligase n=1 Tax=Tetrabaena socialis TaxID=47790 RepID=A0A2J8A097_9CHLO|nr:hypothetical protein TSOC_007741 [Tetrabaena socialis]|eukprot:PNH05951.1 hypothetical protein TSOC_007741 [Tetrabaena socialis]
MRGRPRDIPFVIAVPAAVPTPQAAALGLPHTTLEVTAAPTYLDSYRGHIAGLAASRGVAALATGDIEDVCSAFMPRAAAGTGVALLSPLFGIERGLLLELAWAYGMTPLVTCVNMTKFAGARGPGEAAAAGQTRGGGEEAGEAAAVASAAAASAAAASGSAGAAAVVAQGSEESEEAGKEACSAAAVSLAARAAAAAAPLGGVAKQLLGSVLCREVVREVLEPARVSGGVDVCGEWGEFHTMVTHSCRFERGPLKLSYNVRQEGEYAWLAVEAAE